MLAIRRSHLLLTDRAAMLAAEVRQATAKIVAREREVIYRLSRAAEYRDPETGAHIMRMTHYSALIARRLGWDDEAVESILQAAPMHDIGKLGTPDYILLKPAHLTAGEFEIMKLHTVVGAEILKDSASPMLRMAAEIAVGHHEKFDGSGYPNGLVGEAIPLTARIVAVADVFDALTSTRPYKTGWETGRAVALLKSGRGRHFDPVCVDAFLADLDAILAIRDRFQDPPG
jgi:putative two-component system response regulator